MDMPVPPLHNRIYMVSLFFSLADSLNLCQIGWIELLNGILQGLCF